MLLPVQILVDVADTAKPLTAGVTVITEFAELVQPLPVTVTVYVVLFAGLTVMLCKVSLVDHKYDEALEAVIISPVLGVQ